MIFLAAWTGMDGNSPFTLFSFPVGYKNGCSHLSENIQLRRHFWLLLWMVIQVMDSRLPEWPFLHLCFGFPVRPTYHQRDPFIYNIDVGEVFIAACHFAAKNALLYLNNGNAITGNVLFFFAYFGDVKGLFRSEVHGGPGAKIVDEEIKLESKLLRKRWNQNWNQN